MSNAITEDQKLFNGYPFVRYHKAEVLAAFKDPLKVTGPEPPTNEARNIYPLPTETRPGSLIVKKLFHVSFEVA